LGVLTPQEQLKSKEVLERVREQLAAPDLTPIRRAPHNWGVQLANVSIRIARRMPKSDPGEREIARRLANFCGIVFDFRRKSDPTKHEGNFRNSLEMFLRSSLPDLVPTVIAADMMDDIREWLKGFYEKVPRDLAFLMSDTVVNAYEAHRRTLDTPETHGMMVRFVEENRDLISASVSAASEHIRKRWEELYRSHIGEPPPPPPTGLISTDVRARLKKAAQTNDPLAVRDVLAPLENGLVQAVKKALDASFDLREPSRSVRDYSHKPTAEFEIARRQIRQNNRKAVASFQELWNNQMQNFYAMEWYGYALAKLEGSWRLAKDLFEKVREENHNDETTDWNLACCEIMLGDRKTAFQILHQRVESGTGTGEALEPAIALALEFNEKRFLSQQLDWLPFEEAILLGYLFAADSGAPPHELEAWLSAIEVIASDAQPFEPPDPAERLIPASLNDLCFAFIRRRMLHAGITWFRRRLSFDEHKWFHLNWQLMGNLYLQVNQFEDAVRAYDKMLDCTNRVEVPATKKREAMEEVLNILLERDRNTPAEELLNKYSTMLPPAELNRWRRRLHSGVDVRLPEEPGPAERVGTAEAREEVPPALPQDPLLRLEQLNNRLLKVKRIEQLKGDFGLLTDCTDILYEIWPAYSRRLVEQLRTTIQTLQAFDSSSDAEEKERLSRVLRDNTAGINTALNEINEPQVREKSEDLLTTLKRLAADASFQTSVMRDIEVDWRLNGYLPDRTLPPVSPDLPMTSILLRVTNRGTNPVSDVQVHLQSETGKATVVTRVQRVSAPLDVGAPSVLRFALGYGSLEGEETFLAHTKFSSGGVTNLQTPATRFTLRADSFRRRLNGEETIRDAFFVGVGIPEDRRDVFRGREREQRRIANSLRGNVQSEVLFLNGPRRVGKTSILNSLKWALPELALSEIITVLLPEAIPETTGKFLRQTAAEIGKAVDRHLNVQGYLEIPPAERFDSEPIVAFRDFCEIVQQRLTPRRILLMIDETQRLAQAVKSGRIDDNVFGLFSTLMSRNSGIMLIFTASVLYRNVKEICPHPIWGRVTPYPTGFLNADAVVQVLNAGVVPFSVEFAPEAITRVWQMTEGHPWIVQTVGRRIVTEVLNPQQRLTVGPPDVDQVIESIEKTDDQYAHYWWNEVKEEGGFVDGVDWEVAKIIIDQQENEGCGIPKMTLFEEIKRQNKPINNERINKLVDMQTLVKQTREGEEWVRIKGLFLERWLKDQVRAKQASGVHAVPLPVEVALFVDHENVAISMRTFIEELPAGRQAAWASVRQPVLLARRLAQHAERFGPLVYRVAVANWPLFVHDLPAYAQAMFSFDQPLGGKNTSDEKLKQLIRDTLEQKPNVRVYIVATGDADFRDTIQTLLKRNKHVVLWGFRAVGTIKSNLSGIFREMETWQNVTIEYLDDILLQEPTAKQVNVG
jgi:tetratricopeptide (TPR) repeat protein